MEPLLRGLISRELVAKPVPATKWDIEPSVLGERLASEKLGPRTMRGTGGLPATFLFKTREGGMGILQIVGFTENPKGVKIRYKMLQKDGQARTEAHEAITAIAMTSAIERREKTLKDYQLRYQVVKKWMYKDIVEWVDATPGSPHKRIPKLIRLEPKTEAEKQLAMRYTYTWASKGNNTHSD